MACYDFIIVGGGTSGLVMASRPTENPEIEVLVVEYGQNLLLDPRVEISLLYTVELYCEMTQPGAFPVFHRYVRDLPSICCGFMTLRILCIWCSCIQSTLNGARSLAPYLYCRFLMYSRQISQGELLDKIKANSLGVQAE